LVSKTRQPAPDLPFQSFFGSFWGLARHLNCIRHRPSKQRRAEKGRIQMSNQSQFKQTVVALFAAVLMSSVAVGAAVGPAQAVASPAGVALHA
jgi:hypothetical protein